MKRAPTARQRAAQTRPKEEGLERVIEGNHWEDGDEPGIDYPRDITTGSTTAVQPPYVFRQEAFAQANIQIIAEYAGYRAIGVNAERAFLRTFGTDYADVRLSQRIDALEHNIIYRQVFIEQFAKVKLGDMWGVKMAAWEYLQLVNNPFVKDSTRLSAIKELNVMFNITMIDEQGRTRKGQGLKEFYDSVKGDGEPKPAVTSIRHPDPGTPEAEAMLSARKEADASAG